MHLSELLTPSSLWGQWSEKVAERTVCLAYSRHVSYCAQETGFIFAGYRVRQWWPTEMGTPVQKILAMGQRDPVPQQQPLCPVPKRLLSPTFDGREVISKTFVLHMLHEKKCPKGHLSHATEETMRNELSHPRDPVIHVGNTETLHPDCSSIATSKLNHP